VVFLNSEIIAQEYRGPSILKSQVLVSETLVSL